MTRVLPGPGHGVLRKHIRLGTQLAFALGVVTEPLVISCDSISLDFLGQKQTENSGLGYL